MAEYDEGGLDARHEGQGGDELPEVRHSVMNLDNYYNGMVGYGAVETVMNGLKLKRFKRNFKRLKIKLKSKHIGALNQKSIQNY